MKRMHTRTLLALALGAALVSPAHAALKLGNVFDGNYFNPATSGRGLTVDIVPMADGSNVVWILQFTYDQQGNPTWLGYTGQFAEHQFSGPLTVFRMQGGRPGNGWIEPTQTVIGQANLRVDSCTSMQLDVDMNDDSGFPDATFVDLRPITSPSPQCVYKTAFNACPDFATPAEGMARACALTGVYHQDITLTNDTTWVLNGLVRIGDDNANSATLTIEPGTVLVGGASGTPYLYISPGSRIHADGMPWAPITMTSVLDGFVSGTQPSPGDLGGLVVSGNAPSNACPEAPFNCFSEFDQTQRFGGNNPHDSSGSISYFQVRYAGIEFQPDSEVNSFTFQAVGDNTRVHHIQAFRGADDGVEFFGGTVGVRNLVITEGGDDAVDWDQGYSGNLQYGLVVHGSGLGEDHGIEGASNGDNFDALPRATPTVANFTFIGNGNGGSGILLKEGSGGHIRNSVVSGFPEHCLSMEDEATFVAADPAAGNTSLSGIVMACASNFSDARLQAWFAAGQGNQLADPALEGFQPAAGSPARSGGQPLSHAFFDYTAYRGAFDGERDWTLGWTHRPLGAD